MDLGNHLTKPSVTRQFREVAQAFSGRPATIVLSGHSLKLPDDIAHHAVHLDLALPGPREFDMDRLVTASDGFSGADIEQATVASLYRTLYARWRSTPTSFSRSSITRFRFQPPATKTSHGYVRPHADGS